MVNRLLQRQTSLLEYLSSPAAIFGNEAHVPSGPALQGIDPGLLRLEARFACNLRIKKIIAVFRDFGPRASADRARVRRDQQADEHEQPGERPRVLRLFARPLAARAGGA